MSKKACSNEDKIATKEEANFKCKKCGAKASKEKHLCKPKPIK